MKCLVCSNAWSELSPERSANNKKKRLKRLPIYKREQILITLITIKSEETQDDQNNKFDQNDVDDQNDQHT